jgi:hypothetical protein
LFLLLQVLSILLLLAVALVEAETLEAVVAVQVVLELDQLQFRLEQHTQ